jgi:hypothetical protein
MLLNPKKLYVFEDFYSEDETLLNQKSKEFIEKTFDVKTEIEHTIYCKWKDSIDLRNCDFVSFILIDEKELLFMSRNTLLNLDENFKQDQNCVCVLWKNIREVDDEY